jgi:hypothetical protein
MCTHSVPQIYAHEGLSKCSKTESITKYFCYWSLFFTFNVVQFRVNATGPAFLPLLEKIFWNREAGLSVTVPEFQRHPENDNLRGVLLGCFWDATVKAGFISCYDP